jgi:hypothetical protein
MQTENRLESFVDKIVADPVLHARWLNTFSFTDVEALLQDADSEFSARSTKFEAIEAALYKKAVSG